MENDVSLAIAGQGKVFVDLWLKLRYKNNVKNDVGLAITGYGNMLVQGYLQSEDRNGHENEAKEKALTACLGSKQLWPSACVILTKMILS